MCSFLVRKIKGLVLAWLAINMGLSAQAALKWDAVSAERTAKIEESEIVVPFTFTNVGAEAVTINGVKTSCGCTVAALAKQVFAPGEKGEIKAIFTIGVRTGRQVKQLLVSTSDAPATPTVLTLTVDIPFESQPIGGDKGAPSKAPPLKPRSIAPAAPVVKLSESILHWKLGAAIEEKSVTVSAPAGIKVSLDAINPLLAQMIGLHLEPLAAGGGYALKVEPLDHAAAQNHMILLKVTDANGRPLQSLILNVRVD